MLGIINYGAGNLRSLCNAVDWVGGRWTVIDAPAQMDTVSAVVLPGVGAFIPAMERLRAAGFVDALRDWALVRKRPLIGVCLGMQMLADRSTEGGECEGLGLIPGTVERFAPAPGLRIPHMGWNRVERTRPSLLWGEMETATCYFVHSYHFQVAAGAAEAVVGRAEHGDSFVAMVEMDNVMGTQFHPEKSQKDGLAILSNFVKAVA